MTLMFGTSIVLGLIAILYVLLSGARWVPLTNRIKTALFVAIILAESGSALYLVVWLNPELLGSTELMVLGPIIGMVVGLLMSRFKPDCGK